MNRSRTLLFTLSTLTLALSACGDGRTVDEIMQENGGATTIVVNPAPKEINTRACGVTIEGTAIEAIEAFAATCGTTLYRNCDEIDSGVYQCDNRRPDDTPAPAPAEQSIADLEANEREAGIIVDDATDLGFVEHTPAPEQPRPTGRPQYIEPPRKTPSDPVRVEPERVERTRDPIETIIKERPPVCEVDSISRVEAQKLFGEVCIENGYSLVDCDPTSGNWTCANAPLGDASPIDVDVATGNVQVPVDVDINGEKVFSADTNFDYGVVTQNPIKGSNEVHPPLSWGDSYLANGHCFIDSTLDHGIANVMYDTGSVYGVKTVREIEEILESHPEYRIRRAGDPVYNDVQCGHGPSNVTGNEDRNGGCPGRIDKGRAGCSLVGPKWEFDGFVQKQARETRTVFVDEIVDSRDITSDVIVSTGDGWVEVLEENPTASIWVRGLTDNVAAVIEYISLAYPEVNLKRVNVISVFKEFMTETDPYDTVVRYANFVGVDMKDDIEAYIQVNSR